MVFISRLKLRNFKSFKAADIQLPRTYVCFAGPNGSGKSNLCDAIRFVMGETSLRSLRARKVKDLIHSDSKSAEVTLIFESEKGATYEIKRAIREDGKILYRLNGKKTTRTAIVETLKKYNMDDSGRNTIAQGEVQRIISMNGKERRGIIDAVAGIADFEEKRKEAIRELETVEMRIKEASLVLGERRAYLDDLEREKEVALKFVSNKKNLNNAKANILRMEQIETEKELNEIASSEEKLLFGKNKKEAEGLELQKAVDEIEKKRGELSSKIQSKQKTNALIRKIEDLKAGCASKNQLIEEREALVKRIHGDAEALEKGVKLEKEESQKIKDEITTLSSELKKAQEQLASSGGLREDSAVSALRKKCEEKERELAQSREKLIGLNAEISSKKELINAKSEEEKAIIAPTEADGKESEKEITKLRGQANAIAKEIEEMFQKTKEINAEANETDKKMLELKEKASIFKIRSNPHVANPALAFISMLKEKDRKIYGTLAELITFDQKYARAVEAAAGTRLLYVVVEDVDTASATIEKLKKAGSGRATFIPLDKIRSPVVTKIKNHSSVLEHIDCKDQVLRAVEYVFAETIVVEDVNDAKAIGIGNVRMVTPDGEIYERSGIISGGRAESSLLGASALQKIEKEIAEVKSSKDLLVAELYQIREDEAKLRAQKSQLEIKIKTIEIEKKISGEKESQIRRKTQLQGEINDIEEIIKAKANEVGELGKTLEIIEDQAKKYRLQLVEVEEKSKEQNTEANRKVASLSAAVSSIEATIEGKKKEFELRHKEMTVKAEKLHELNGEKKRTIDGINEAKRQLEAGQKDLERTESEISAASRDIEQLFSQMKSYEAEFAALGKKLGEKRLEAEKLTRDLNQLDIRKAGLSTHLQDITVEAAQYPDAEILELKREELSKMAKECEGVLSSLGNVNMAAIEMYDKKKAEIEGVEEKIEKLDVERKAIHTMIEEIEEHKKDAFFETFRAVSDNFAKMFKYVQQVGEGYLSLDKPNEPFESGLFIKIRRNNRDYSLEALSGGEKTLVAMMFIFALQFFKPSPFYILDEVDAALDKANSKNLAHLISQMGKDSQFIVVSHNDAIMGGADSVIGVAKAEGLSKLVGIKLRQVATV
ncbi:chromosome segregation protein SMC [Candidatus Micrarchaeota archaeon]|nr:chromosome segregation protein SMC [Candidatus Micrarchaeota archaeon]